MTATDRNRRIGRQPFRYSRCTDCGTLQLRPVPGDLGRYYPPSYYGFPADRDELRRVSEPEGYKRDLVRGEVDGGRLVEIGPAAGGFLVVMQEAGFDCSAIEMDAACCRFLTDVVGVPAHESDDPARALSGMGTFDVVALWHVIEHVPDPAEVLAAAAGALARGGIVILASPNPDSLQMRLLGRRWVHLDAPRHLSLIPRAQLIALAHDLGLDLVLETTDDVGGRTWNLFGWRESLAGCAKRSRSRALLRIVGSVIARLAMPFERRPGHGAAYTLILRRPL